jgi:methylated-DNA-protein-cysteine methyltransferase related protein
VTEAIIQVIKSIPRGKVATFGQVARLAGYSNGARQVVRILHACTEKYALPWHRVINAKGEIGLSIYSGADEQRALLKGEGIVFCGEFRIDLTKYQWQA